MKDIYDFLNWKFYGNMSVQLNVIGSRFIESQPVVSDDLNDIIAHWMIHSQELNCIIDLEGVDIFKLDIIGVIRLIRDLEEFNKTDILKSIHFINATKLHEWIYFCARLGISRETRKVIHFSRAGRNVS